MQPMFVEIREGVSEKDYSEVAAVLSDAFTDYPIKMTWSAETLRTMFEGEDVVAQACRVAVGEGGRVLGAGLAALRGERGRVAAMGVARQAHRSGIGRALGEALLAALRLAGAREVVLEALTTNAPALALYEGPLGFTRRRRLVGFTRAASARPITPGQWETALSGSPEPDSWQLSRVGSILRSQENPLSVPPVVPERHALASLLRESGFEEAKIAQHELGRSLH
jgi:ribosomal protein S18 acetylase RimI-like enzyme